MHELLAHTWKPGQPAVPFPGAPSSPCNEEGHAFTDPHTYKHKPHGRAYDGWHTSVPLPLFPLCLPLTSSPICPLSPGAPLIPLCPLGP